ncbi:hypothetical protein [Candidatus Pantoea soli]|uniref:hypothetical protein n=1 Tax=Candidatus Pantoea soli TaxID=3098669 RepID=UPI001649422A|nr:hypothetical protein [Pantoea soli]
MMKQRMQQWWQRVTLRSARPAVPHDTEAPQPAELLLPFSQLYGIELPPSAWRYHER